MLKVDCEGAEHEFLPGCKSLGRVDWFSAEFHINAALTRVGRDNAMLAAHVASFVDPNRITISAITMGQ